MSNSWGIEAERIHRRNVLIFEKKVVVDFERKKSRPNQLGRGSEEK